jgi:hypothetical protein
MEKVECDPFTGKELLYKQLPDGIVIYSVGEDRKDDGGDVLGVTRTENRQPGNYQWQEPTDLGIRLWNPERRGKSP